MDDLDALLPMPTGDSQLLLNMGKNLAYVSRHGIDTVLARDGANGLGLGASWAGPAFAAANAEAQAGARLSHEVSERVGPVVSAVNQYAGELTSARQTVEALREQWRAADRLLADTVHQPLPATADPTAGLQLVEAANAHRERSHAELLTRHTACVRSMEASEDRAAAAVSAALGDGVSAGGQRQLLLAQLALTEGSARRAEVTALVEQACAGLWPDPASWTAADLVRVLGALAGSIEDPLVAQALMARLGPSGLDDAARALGVLPGESGLPDAASHREALRLLGLAFATSVSDTAVPDPVSGTVLDQWRPGWVQHLLEQPISSITDQLALVAAAAPGPRGIRPGFAYAVGAARTLLTRSGQLTDRFDWQPTTREGRPTITLGLVPDPYRLLFSALESDPALAHRVLLAAGSHGETILHDLVVDRPLASTGTRVPLTSSIALGELIGRLDLGRDDPLVPAFLDAVGDAGQGWWALAGQDSINADRHLNPMRWLAAVLLSEQSARVWEAIDPLHPDPAGGSADGSSKARMQALVGEIAKDVPTSPDGAATPRGLRMLLASLATSEAQRLGEQVDAAPPGTRPVALDEAAMRLGQVVGFTAESATVALRHAGEQVDAVNAKERSVVHGLTGGADLVPLPKGHPATAVLSLIRDPVLQVVTTAFDNAHPVNNAAMVTAREEVLMGQAQQLVTTSAGGQVLARLGHQAASQVQVGLAATNVRTGAGAVNREGPAPIAAP